MSKENQTTLADRENEIELSPRKVEVNDEMRAMGAVMKEAALQAAKEKQVYGREDIAVLRETNEKMIGLCDAMIKAQKTARVASTGLPQQMDDREDLDACLMREPNTDWEREFHRLNDMAHTTCAVMAANARATGQSFNPATVKAVVKLRKHIALTAGEWFTNEPAAAAEEGGAWVPTGYSVTMIDLKRLSSRVFGSLPFRVLPNREGPHRVPVKSSPSAWQLLNNAGVTMLATPVNENHAFTGNFTTAFVELTPKRHMGATAFDAAFGEDSIMDQFQSHTAELVAGAPQILDACVINGQPEDTGFDTTLGQAFANGYGIGFREYSHVGAGAAEDGGGGSVLVALESARRLMGKWGVMPDELGYYLPPGPYIGLVQTGGTGTALTTVDKLGPNATLITGQVASLYGSPVFVSEMHLNNLDSTVGDADAVGDTTSMEVVNRTAWIAGAARSLQTEVHRQPGIDAWRVYGFMRTHIGPVVELDNAASDFTANNVHTVTEFNIAP